eukprot:3241135-Pleurochrysis_carterae.AAC.1
MLARAQRSLEWIAAALVASCPLFLLHCLPASLFRISLLANFTTLLFNTYCSSDGAARRSCAACFWVLDTTLT